MSDNLEDRITELELRVKKLNRNLMMIGIAVIMTAVAAMVGAVK